MNTPRYARDYRCILSPLFCLFAVAVSLAAPGDGYLKVAGTVQLPSGAPAANAVVTAFGEPGVSFATVSCRTDELGSFELPVPCAHAEYRLHARTEDSANQTTLVVPSQAARKRFAQPIALKLAPATPQVVVVTRDGKPVANAYVVARSRFADEKEDGRSGADGKVKLFFAGPTNPLDRVDVWHPEVGVGMQDRLSAKAPPAVTEVALLRTAQCVVHVVDGSNAPVPNLRFGVSGAVDPEGYTFTGDMAPAELRTDKEGDAIVPWFPAERLRSADVEIRQGQWTLDDVNFKEVSTGFVSARVRRLITVEGRVRMPPGVSPEGVLINGSGHGPANRGYAPMARARADGTFSMQIAPDHQYAMGIADDDWVSDVWTGTISADGVEKPTELTFDAIPAVPLTIRVLSGPKRAPVSGARVLVRGNQLMTWNKEGGRKFSAFAGIERWLRTDENGTAKTGVGQGEHLVALRSGPRFEDRTVQVADREPAVVEFLMDSEPGPESAR